MKKKLLYVSIILLLSAFILGLYNNTYAKYRERLDSNTNLTVARWNIKINSEEIKNKTTLTQNLSINYIDNAYIANGVIAPGRKGYFDIEIDSSEVDVAFDYTLESEIDDTSLISDLRLIGYKLNPTGPTDITNYTTISNNQLQGTIAVADTITNIRVFLEWYDGNDNQMDNATDTDVVINNREATITINKMTFTQKL